MKAHYRAFGGRLVIEVEADNITSLFQQISPVSEVLDADQCCGKCGSTVIYPRARTAQGFNFYELVCGDSKCGARLSFGQHKTGGTLFPKREDEQGNKMDHNGWKVYLGLAAPAADTPRAQAQAQRPAAAPQGRRPPASPAPSAAAKTTIDNGPDQELKALLMRAAMGQQPRERVEAELCDRLRALKETPANAEALVTECWGKATNPYVDDDDTLRRLYAMVKEKEGN